MVIKKHTCFKQSVTMVWFCWKLEVASSFQQNCHKMQSCDQRTLQIPINVVLLSAQSMVIWPQTPPPKKKPIKTSEPGHSSRFAGQLSFWTIAKWLVVRQGPALCLYIDSCRPHFRKKITGNLHVEALDPPVKGIRQRATGRKWTATINNIDLVTADERCFPV